MWVRAGCRPWWFVVRAAVVARVSRGRVEVACLGVLGSVVCICRVVRACGALGGRVQ